MRPIRSAFQRLCGLFRKRRWEREMADELASHLDLHTEDNIRAGMSPKEARRAAVLKLGGVEATKEAYRDRYGIPLLETVAQDVRYSLRMLRRNPGFAAVAILTLGLGIGANTAIFSLFELIALRQLPVPYPGQLVMLQWTKNQPPEWTTYYSDRNCEAKEQKLGKAGCSFPFPTADRFRAGTKSFSGMLTLAGTMNLQVGLGEAVLPAWAEQVSGDFFSTLGIQAQRGRTFDPSDDQPGSEPVIVLSHAFWRERFGGDTAVVGRTIPLNGVPFRVIGIAPKEFRGLQAVLPTDLWITHHGVARFDTRWPRINDERAAWLYVIGRLKPGARVEQARAELEVIFRQGLAPDTRNGTEPDAQPGIAIAGAAEGLNPLRQRFLPTLHVLAAAAGMILLIVCANIAGLLVARAAARHKELAARMAVGAGRWRLARQFLTESLVLTTLGCALGLLLAWPGSHLLTTWIRSRAGAPVALDVGPSWFLFGFALAVSGFAVLLFGLVPGMASTRVEPAAALKASAGLAGGGGRRRRGHVGRSLIAVEAALALVLLIGAGLFLRTLINLKTLDPGFRKDHLLTLEVSQKPGTGRARVQPVVYAALRSRLAALPGVVSVTWSMGLPLTGSYGSSGIAMSGATGSRKIEAIQLRIGPRFFETMEIPVLAGRNIRPEDCQQGAAIVVWVNQSLARRYFPNGNVVGQRIGQSGGLEIVGIVGNTKHTTLRSEIGPMIFNPAVIALNFILRTASNPASLERAARQAVESTAPGLRIGRVGSLSEQIDQQLSNERILARLSAAFGILALSLAAIGVYGAVAYSVARRTGEIAIRVSLGALPRDVARLILLEGLLPVVVGILAGLPVAYGLTRLLTAFLFGVKPLDTLTFCAAAIVLLGAAVVACCIPLRRALRVEPMAALRCE